MEYYKLPQSDLTVSKIALGCMRISGKSVEEVEALVKTALDLGINFFDHILSRIMKTLSNDSSGKPLYEAIAFKILLSLILIWKFLNPNFPSVVVVAKISSISAKLLGSPNISISHCIN